jgi:RND family efflux transporter MFP subunit
MFLVAAALAMAGCSPHRETAKSVDPPNVGTQLTRLGDISQTVAVTGALVALGDVPLSAKQGGRLTDVSFHDGDHVTAGQVVARIDPTDLLSAVREDEAAVASNRANLENARAAYEKQLASTRTGIVSASAAYQQQVAQSSAEVRSARAALESARANLSEVQEGDRPEERLKTQASLSSAQANYKKAQADYKRYDKLHNAGAISDADMDKYRNALDTAEADMNSAQASLTLQLNGNRRQDIAQAQQKVLQAEETLRKAEAARATDAVRKADLEAAKAAVADNDVKRANIKSAQALLEQSIATLAVARQAVRDAVIVSPISGFVSGRAAEPGQVVSSGSTLLHIVSLDNVYYEPSVPNSQIAAIRPGQPVEVTVDALPGKTFKGTVSRVYPESSSTTRSVSIRVTLPNANGSLRPAMYAKGLIATTAHKGVILAPSAAVVDDPGTGSSSVYVVDNGVARKRMVKRGIASADGTLVEITGVPSGTQTVVDGLTGIADGQKVTASPVSLDTVR